MSELKYNQLFIIIDEAYSDKETWLIILYNFPVLNEGVMSILILSDSKNLRVRNKLGAQCSS